MGGAREGLALVLQEPCDGRPAGGQRRHTGEDLVPRVENEGGSWQRSGMSCAIAVGRIGAVFKELSNAPEVTPVDRATRPYGNIAVVEAADLTVFGDLPAHQIHRISGDRSNSDLRGCGAT